jgi:hypothetical protein
MASTSKEEKFIPFPTHSKNGWRSLPKRLLIDFGHMTVIKASLRFTSIPSRTFGYDSLYNNLQRHISPRAFPPALSTSASNGHEYIHERPDFPETIATNPEKQAILARTEVQRMKADLSGCGRKKGSSVKWTAFLPRQHTAAGVEAFVGFLQRENKNTVPYQQLGAGPPRTGPAAVAAGHHRFEVSF